MKREIKFYSVNANYGEFSNFAPYPIRMDGQMWPTTEHYFQAMKFTSKRDHDEIRKARSPMEAARKGRDRKRKLRKDWNEVKDDVMRQAVYAKFTQHPQLTKRLRHTEDALLIENAKNDAYWGDGGDGSGKNMLGIILMEVREQLSDR